MAPVNAVIMVVKKIIKNFIRPLVTGIRMRAKKAPRMMPKPIGRDRMPIPTGSLPGKYQQAMQSDAWGELTIDVVNLGGPEKE